MLTFVTQTKYNLDSMEIFRGQTPKPVHGYDSSLLATASYLFSTQQIMFFFDLQLNKLLSNTEMIINKNLEIFTESEHRVCLCFFWHKQTTVTNFDEINFDQWTLSYFPLLINILNIYT